MTEIVMVARTDQIATLVQACSDGTLAFSGPDSLCERVAAMGYRTEALHEMVRAAERAKIEGAG